MDVAVIQLFMNNRPGRVDWTVLRFWLILSGLHSTGAAPCPCDERVGTIQVLFGAILLE